MNVKVITQLQELPQFDTTQPVFCDIETQGLYINTRLIQFYQPTLNDTIYIVDLAPIGYNKNTYNDNLQSIIDVMKTLHLVFYNASYDLGTLNLVPDKVDDLFYAVKSAYPEFMEFSLDKVTTKMGFGNMYAGIDKKKLQKQGFVLGAYLSQQQLKYSALDVLALSKMWEDTKIQTVIATNMAYKVDILSLQYAIQYQQNGMDVHIGNRNKALEKAEQKAEELQSLLPGLNVNSPKQVTKFLHTEKSDRSTLIHLASSSSPYAKYANLILELRKVRKDISYLNGIQFPVIYTKFNVTGAATGRFTSSGGDLPDGANLQQIPRHLGDCYGIPEDGDDILIGSDYSTLELRLACAIYNEPRMYEIFKNGKDLHYETAANLYHKKDINGEERNNAKPVNFGFTFGMSAARFKEYAFTMFGTLYTDEEAKKMRAEFFKAYPNFKIYHTKTWESFQKGNLIVETGLGRKIKPKLGTDAVNIPVQGSGAECTKLSIHYMYKENPKVLDYIVNVIHDCIVLKVPKSEKDYWKKVLGDGMLKGWTEMSKTKIFHFNDIPMPIEVNEGYVYKDVK